jgi:hypothetical protein
MAIVELLIGVLVVYATGCLWPDVTLAALSFAIGLAYAQCNPNMPRIASLLHSGKVAIARLLSRSDDLGSTISEVAASTVRMTTAQAKAIIERESKSKSRAEPEATVVAADAADNKKAEAAETAGAAETSETSETSETADTAKTSETADTAKTTVSADTATSADKHRAL